MRKLSIFLWLLVLIAAGIFLADRLRSKPLAVSVNTGHQFKQLPWKHLPAFADFTLTGIDGRSFESSALTGRPFAVNFFFSTCPTICRQFNAQVARLTEQFRTEDLTFLSLTVDPQTDTPERLAEYALQFEADPERWRFLTGSFSDLQQFAERSFRVKLERETHTEKIFLIDRWGRVRDEFSWDDPQEMERFAQVAREVLDETEPPWEKSIETRNLMAGLEHSRQFRPTWLDEFFLRRADGSVLYSRDLIGEVWIGSVFFSTCTTHCIEQNRYLRDLQDRLGDRPVRLVSITTDPQTDTPERLRRYASELKAQPNRWLFLTEDDKAYLDRVAVEFLGLFVQGSDHATKLAVVDRWGRVRLRVDWRRPEEEAAMFAQLDELIAERRPPGAQPPTP